LRVITQPMPPTDLETTNRRELRKLELSIEAQPQSLGLLLAICDDRNLQAQLIEQYEAELQAAGIATYRTRLSHQRPSLKAALMELVEQEPALQTGDPAVVTVLNAGELLGVRLTAEKSEQEKFFFSLQWTRESLRQFNFPIVLWLPDDVATRLAQQAPDFWSWRSGVFEFYAVAQPDSVTRSDGMQPLPMHATTDSTNADNQIPIAELEQQIVALEATSPESPLLATLYNELGNVHGRKYRYRQALEFFQKALKVAVKTNNLLGQAVSLKNIGDALSDCGRFRQAIAFYEKALAFHRELKNSYNEADLLNSIGLKYEALGEYQLAKGFYEKSLKVSRLIGSRQFEANIIGNLGNISYWMGDYGEAIELYQKSLTIEREIGNSLGEATSLGNLGLVYQAIEQYDQAIVLLKENLKISQNIGDICGEARSLGNIGNTYILLNQYENALPFCKKTLELFRQINDRQGESTALGNLGIIYGELGHYEDSISFHQQYLETAHEIGDRRGQAYALSNQADVLWKLGQISEARSHYEAAQAIFNDLGLEDLAEQCEKAMQALND